MITKGSTNYPLNNPTGVFVDKLGDIYIADQNNARIVKVSYYPEIVIKKGELSSYIDIAAIEELPENSEDNEEIIMTPSLKLNC